MCSFWQNVNKLLKSKNITQEILAQKINISKNTLFSRISKNILPPVDDAYKIAQALGVSVEYLLTGNSTNPAEVELQELKDKIKIFLNSL